MKNKSCKTCIHNLDNYCTIGNTAALKHWNLPAKYGGCGRGLQFSDKLEPVDRPTGEPVLCGVLEEEWPSVIS